MMLNESSVPSSGAIYIPPPAEANIARSDSSGPSTLPDHSTEGHICSAAAADTHSLPFTVQYRGAILEDSENILEDSVDLRSGHGPFDHSMKNGPNVAGSSTSLSPPVSMSNTGSLRSILRGPGNRRRKDLLNVSFDLQYYSHSVVEEDNDEGDIEDEDEDSSDEEVQEKSVWYEELGLLSGIRDISQPWFSHNSNVDFSLDELPPPAPPPPTAITSSFYNESEYPIHLPDPIAPLDYRVLQNRALAFTFQLEKEAKESVQDNTDNSASPQSWKALAVVLVVLAASWYCLIDPIIQYCSIDYSVSQPP